MINNYLRKVIITGGEGLIGKSITSVLSNNGVDNHSLDISIDKTHNVIFPEIFNVLDKLNPSLIIHAAAHPGGKSLEEPLQNTLINTQGSMNIIDWCIKNKVPLVFTSSSAVYGNQKKIMLNEEMPTNPGTVYAINKVAVEEHIKLLFNHYKIPFIIFRLFATYGSGHKPNTFQGIVNVMMTQIKNGTKVEIKGSLDRKRDIIYCEDAAELIYECMNNESAWNRTINIGTGKALTIKEIIKTIAKVMDRPFEQLSLVETKGTIGDPQNSVADTSLLDSITNYRCQFKLDAAIKKMISNKK